MIRRSWLGIVAAAVLLIVEGRLMAEPAVSKDIVTTALGAGSFKTLAAALEAAGLAETLQKKGPFTVFAPTDDAFAKLPAGTVEALLKPENKSQLIAVLTYHVVPGKALASDVVKLNAASTVNGQRVDIKVSEGTVKVDQAAVVTADVVCSNGVIHVIDQVILPSRDNIPVTAANAGTFKTLLAAAKAAGLVEALSGDQPLTVFAPTDEAFKKLPEGTVANLLKPENKEQLASILKFHVVPGRVFSTELLKTREVKTLNGSMLSASQPAGAPKVNGAGLLAVDIDASNGVIHVIDTVLLPPVPEAKQTHAAPHPTRSVSYVCPQTGRVLGNRPISARR